MGYPMNKDTVSVRSGLNIATAYQESYSWDISRIFFIVYPMNQSTIYARSGFRIVTAYQKNCSSHFL